MLHGNSDGVHVVLPEDFSTDTPQTPGLVRAVAVDARLGGVGQLCGFVSTVKPGAATGAHHHGDQETILYVLEGVARIRWGETLEEVAEAGAGSFVFIGADVIHQEINPSADDPTSWVVVRSGASPIVVNLPDLDPHAETPAIDYSDPE